MQAAATVHEELGTGFYEAVYQHCLQEELEDMGIPVEREVGLPIHYKGRATGLVYRVDLLCHGDLLVELKALPWVGPREVGQVLHYLKATQHPTGLLLNFGAPKLQHHVVLRPRAGAAK